MKNARSRLPLATAALAVLLAPAPARAASYELIAEWTGVSFQDGGKDQILFTHLPDSDLFMHMQDFETRASSEGWRSDIHVPLYALTLESATRKDGREDGDVESALLRSHVSAYKMLVRLDNQEQHSFVIKRAPDFQVEVSSPNADLRKVFALKTSSPENVLVMVVPELPPSPLDALSDIELAAVASLEAAERTAMVGECGGEPGSAAAMSCWHDKIRRLLDSHKAQSPGQELSAFDQRYMQHRLSSRGYEQFHRDLSSRSGDKLALARSWHDMVLGQDLGASQAAVKVATAAAVARTKAPARSALKPAASSAAAPPAATQPAAGSGARKPWLSWMFLLIVLVLVVGAYAGRSED